MYYMWHNDHIIIFAAPPVYVTSDIPGGFTLLGLQNNHKHCYGAVNFYPYAQTL